MEAELMALDDIDAIIILHVFIPLHQTNMEIGFLALLTDFYKKKKKKKSKLSIKLLFDKTTNCRSDCYLLTESTKYSSFLFLKLFNYKATTNLPSNNHFSVLNCSNVFPRTSAILTGDSTCTDLFITDSGLSSTVCWIVGRVELLPLFTALTNIAVVAAVLIIASCRFDRSFCFGVTHNRNLWRSIFITVNPCHDHTSPQTILW